MGADGAARAVSHLAKAAAILSAGFCGAVEPGLRLGSVVVASQVVRDTASFLADPLLLETATRALARIDLPFHVGTILTVDRVITPGDDMHARTDLHISAVDMESGYLAEAARRQGIPFLGIRAVSDTPTEPWATEGRVFLKPDGRLKPVTLAASILKHPSWVPRMLQLVFTLRLATRQLAQGIEALLKEHPNLLPP
jgi:adenosylhomocysteine nucleosidase